MLEIAQVQEILTRPDQFTYDRKYSEKLNFQINGYSESAQVQIIKGFEGKTIKEIREKYGIPINWLWSWILAPVSKIFSASGGSIDVGGDDKQKEKAIEAISFLKTGHSLRQWMQKYWLKSYITNPAGVIVMEYNQEYSWPEIYHIDKIKAYSKTGRFINWIIFKETKVIIGGKEKQAIRVIDDEYDSMYEKIGKSLKLIDEYKEKDSFIVKKGQYKIPKQWKIKGFAPALVLGDIPDQNKKKTYLSVIDEQVRLGEQYYNLDTIKTFVAIKNGYGTYYWYTRACKKCEGKGWLGSEDQACPECGGGGRVFPKNINDVYTIDLDDDSVNNFPDKPGGIIEGDVSSWQEYREEQKINASNIELSHWGTHRTEAGDNNTATGAFVDVQTAIDRLNDYAASAEFVNNWIATYIAIYKIPSIEYVREVYGRRYQVENPDAILSKLIKGKEQGLSQALMNRNLKDYYDSEYKNDPALRSRMIKLMQVEPAAHLSITEFVNLPDVNEMDKLKKIHFSQWESGLLTSEVNTKTVETLKEELNKFVEPIFILNETQRSTESPGQSTGSPEEGGNSGE